MKLCSHHHYRILEHAQRTSLSGSSHSPAVHFHDLRVPPGEGGVGREIDFHHHLERELNQPSLNAVPTCAVLCLATCGALP